jgi:hypothetical protein
MMIPNPTAIILILAPVLILILFLPAIIELKKPKDQGPRMIMEVPKMTLSLVHVIPIANMEREQKFDSSLIQTMAKITAFLPSLEV